MWSNTQVLPTSIVQIEHHVAQAEDETIKVIQ